MKEIIVMSDSHGLVHEIAEICNRHEADYIFHCGDSELSREEKVLQNITTVEGNCDQFDQFKQDEIVVVEGVRFLITHGHLYNVKQQLSTLSYRASELEADVVCFGHSHVVHADQDTEHVYINPGSIRIPRSPAYPTYVVLTLDNDQQLTWTLWSVDGEKVTSKVFEL